MLGACPSTGFLHTRAFLAIHLDHQTRGFTENASVYACRRHWAKNNCTAAGCHGSYYPPLPSSSLQYSASPYRDYADNHAQTQASVPDKYPRLLSRGLLAPCATPIKTANTSITPTTYAPPPYSSRAFPELPSYRGTSAGNIHRGILVHCWRTLKIGNKGKTIASWYRCAKTLLALGTPPKTS